MTEEEKKAAEEAEALAEAEAEAQKAQLQTDYEAEKKAEEDRVAKEADRVKAEAAFKERQEKREGLSKEDVEALLDERDRYSTEERALEVARRHTKSEAEAQAALTYFKSRVKPTGNLEEDVLFAIGGMNSKAQAAKTAELARALQSKDTASADTASGQHDGIPSVAPKLPENSPLKSYKHEGGSIYSKKLESGRTMYVNTNPQVGQPARWTD